MLTPEEIARLRADAEASHPLAVEIARVRAADDGTYPTAQDCRDVAETLYWLSLRTDGHEGSDDRERYRSQARKLMHVAALVEANPNYFTEQHILRAA